MASTTVAILSSKILGPQALLEHGFDWVEKPDADRLAITITKLHFMEQSWIARIRKWQAEGTMGDDPVEVSPGSLVWLVATDDDVLARGDGTDLGKIAQMVGSCEPHATISFERDFNAREVAAGLTRTLQCCSPIPYCAPSRKGKGKAAAVKATIQAGVEGGALLPA